MSNNDIGLSYKSLIDSYSSRSSLNLLNGRGTIDLGLLPNSYSPRIGNFVDGTGSIGFALKSSPEIYSSRVGNFVDGTGRIGFGLKSSPEIYSSRVGNFVDGKGRIGFGLESSPEIYSSRRGNFVDGTGRIGFGLKSSADIYSSRIGNFVDWTGRIGFGLKSSPEIYSSRVGNFVDGTGRIGIGLKSSADIYSSRRGNFVDGTGRIGFGLKSSADIYSSRRGNFVDGTGTIGFGLKCSSSDICLAHTGNIGMGRFADSEVFFRNRELGSLQTDFSSVHDNIIGSFQEFQTGIGSYGSPLSQVATRTYYDLPNRRLDEDSYRDSARGDKRRRFELWLPLQFNDGRNVPTEMVEEAKRELLKLFGGVSWENQTCGGLWEDRGVEYRDELMRVLVDAPNLESSLRKMQQFNERWRQRLGQVKLYMTTSVVEIM